MNRSNPKPAAPRLKRVLAFVTLAFAAGAASAALTDIANAPLSSASSTVVKPNISFSLDTSGSMAWSHAPDDAETFYNRYGYKSKQCNLIYYDRAINYVPPKNADGTNFPNATFTGAWQDGFDTGAGTVNLSTSFRAFDNTSSAGNGADTPAQAAYYYQYTGTQVEDFINTAGQYYRECNTPLNFVPTTTIVVAGGSSSTSVTSIRVNGVLITSGATSASTSNNTVASRIASAITLAGFSATSSGSTVNITGPLSAFGFTPVIVKTGTKTVTPVAFPPAPPFTKVVVSATSGPLASDERVNFANWYSYYRTRILMMKSGVGRAFVSIGSTYRVGFLTIYGVPSSSTTDPQYLRISDFDAAHKAAWYSKIYATNPTSGTPLRTALTTAGRNFAGVLGPDPLQYSCQQNFLILTTDGYWNAGSANPVRENGTTSVGNRDNVIGTSPRPIYDGGNASATNTLADAAWYYYNTDLRQGTIGSAQCTTGVLGADVCQNNVPVSGLDNASWQHMTTFTLGLGVNGVLKFASDYLTGGSVDYNAIVGGSRDWPVPVGDTRTTTDDLWHAAVNGHGQYFSAKNPDLLVTGLRTALAGVSAREAAGAAAATSNLEPVAGDNFAFVANYRTIKWDGNVEARLIDITTGIFSGVSQWQAQPILDTMVQPLSDTRRIFTRGAGGVGQREFLPGNFSAAEKLLHFTPSANPQLSQVPGWLGPEAAAATADTLINYLRGQTGFEMRASNVIKLYREREHVLGDIIDGKPVYVKAPPFNYGNENNYDADFKIPNASRQGIVYVAANDGMLHAFNATTGVELWAYVPSFVWPKMKQLADSNYATNHIFTVDGSPTVSDVYTGSAWKTILVAGLNAGGSGYYALDITDPAAPTVIWEFTDPNMGLTFGNPVIGKLTVPGFPWIVAFTSGYNNADGVGRLFVRNAYSGTERIPPISTNVGTAASPSGLGKISAWVDNGLVDNTIQRIYGGDLLGNLWRFDVNGILPGPQAMVLFTTKAGQPITTKPELGLVGTIPMIYVGTGRYLGSSDVADTTQQSLYAIRDELTGAGIGNAGTAGCVVQQTLAELDTNTRVVTSNTLVPLTSPGTCGWRINFDIPSTPGERINVDMKLQLGVLGVIANIPENSICTVGGSSFIYFFDFADGTNVGDFVEITDVNGVPSAHASNKVGERIGSSTAVGMNTYRLPDGRVVTTVTTADDRHPVYGNPSYGGLMGATRRVLWRELLN